MKFIHTSDWQIGAPFARIDDPHKRALVRQARVDVIKRVGAVVHENGAAFVVVAGDLFDSPASTRRRWRPPAAPSGRWRCRFMPSRVTTIMRVRGAFGIRSSS